LDITIEMSLPIGSSRIPYGNPYESVGMIRLQDIPVRLNRFHNDPLPSIGFGATSIRYHRLPNSSFK
jgi:hypothetical protein